MFTTTFLVAKVMKLLGITKTTLLRWEARGLVPKASRNTKGGRIYQPEEVITLVKGLNAKRRWVARAEVEGEIGKTEEYLKFLRELLVALSLDAVLVFLLVRNLNLI